ncbi:ABC transporter ATP-binding protein [Sulfitobacter donghicola]|uniref:ABC transporter domain-containing protein n=1 Tax=Sulfitobacter donghicola DSW-25 = KCTC 12864 = JCM 14565 TaxID=1300350 RepID=A0A073ISG5_9RHOB|nr:ATP-binding cassette domain-containing protein [Sulfitobacter donghicola]KEJ88337.1 hypothetical protein DSW25_16810 [Sulfitobacter donghicola DSW-25 = KCTC 12864 = JCM 14565]KIN68935.1 Oligopeptide transport ATP-binding protein oppf [Sulfitobacter donghicola DSW-25 = KCTC 12864 = JCM 14565]
MLELQGISKRYQRHQVLADIDLTIGTGEVLGLIGRSGAGKSTLARCLVGLETPETGAFWLEGRSFIPGSRSCLQDIQYLWQDPAQSLSPYLTARAAVLESLHGFKVGPKTGRRAEAEAILTSLGITGALQDRRPHALSGGQCQRVALARALAAKPKLLILDEPLSSLDLVTQVTTIALLRQLHSETGLAMLIVSHDLAPLRQLADRILVLDEGAIVEDLGMGEFAAQARHPLSRAYIDRF